ncbi:MAG: hypothetical protein ABJN65_06490 [Parasphingorhabdus sp.]
MIKQFRCFGLSSIPVIFASAMLAIIPTAPASGMMILEICDPDGQIRTISIPLEQEDGQDPNCANPCHACLSRKTLGKQGSRTT